jgi:signal transduction histidine kinase
MDLQNVSPFFAGYVLAYGVATAVCVVAFGRARRIEDRHTRRGLLGLLIGSGGWAAWELFFLLAPTPAFKYGSYLISLIVGFSTVWAWLYFCSAYTGRSFHLDSWYRRGALTVYLVVVVVKVTNPLHGLYFTTYYVTEPFTHLAVMHGTLHWVATGLSYALVAVGFFMLYEMFLESGFDTHPLAVVVGITGLPVLFDILGFTSSLLVDMNYEPLGVAVFAVGVLYIYDEEFLAVQLTDGVDDAVIYLTDDGRVQQFNDAARALFPTLPGAVGSPLSKALPAVAARVDADARILDRTHDGDRRHYLVSETRVSLGQADIGRIVMLSDVTGAERQRRELDRQNDQLEDFAAAIRHELLNTLQIVSGRVTIAGEALESGDVGMARESLRTASKTASRMSSIVDDLSTLARHGQTLEESTQVDVGSVARAAWETLDTDDRSLSVSGTRTIDANRDRLHGLFESAFSFAVHNGASNVTVEPIDDGFCIADDGSPVGSASPEQYFQYGVSVPDAAAGMLLPNVRTLARTHGWNVTIDPAYTDGIRLLFTGVTVLPGKPNAETASGVGEQSA